MDSILCSRLVVEAYQALHGRHDAIEHGANEPNDEDTDNDIRQRLHLVVLILGCSKKAETTDQRTTDGASEKVVTEVVENLRGNPLKRTEEFGST